MTDDLFDLFKAIKESQEYFTVHKIMDTYKTLASVAPEIAYQLSKEIIFYTIKNDQFKKATQPFYTSYKYPVKLLLTSVAAWIYRANPPSPTDTEISLGKQQHLPPKPPHILLKLPSSYWA